MLRKAKEIEGFTIYGADGEIGKVEDLFFDEDYWVVRYVRVNTNSRHFSRKILVSTAALREVNWNERRFDTGLTREMIQNSPEVDFSRPISRRKEEEIDLHFGWPVYWEVSRYPEYPGTTEPKYPEVRKPEYIGPARTHFSPSVEEERRKEVEAEAVGGVGFHIRDLRQIIGGSIQATDGEAGHVRDLLMADDSWAIRYLAVDTRTLLPGKHVLIPPQMVMRIDWDESRVYITIRKDVVKMSPAYDPDRELDRTAEDEVYDYYAHHSY